MTQTRPAEAAPASLREALADANKIIAMMRRHCSEDHPDCAYAALGVMQDAHRAALAASPSAGALTYEEWVERVAVALHEDCKLDWQAIAVADPIRQVTQHGPDAHWGKAHALVRRLDLKPNPLVTYTDPAGGPDWEPREDER